MKAMKFRVESPEHSRQIQERLFEMGYEWFFHGKTPMYLDAPRLVVGENGHIIYIPYLDDRFYTVKCKETTLQDIQWQPKQGEMIEVSDNKTEWYPMEFLSMYNGRHVCKHRTNDRWFPYKHARPINTIQREIDELQAKIDELKKRL